MSRLNVLGGLVRLMMPAGVISALYAGRLAEVEGRRIDPKAQALLDLVATVRGPEPVYDVATSREQLAGFVKRFDQPGPEGVRRTEEELPGAEGVRAARVYNPEGAKPARTLLYFHGGGWIQGSIDTHDALCAKLCAGAGIRVISYDYRLAPEDPFPAAPDDVLAAYLGLVSGGLDLSADPAQLVVGGDSAGGNLAAGLMHDLRAGGHPLPTGQLLIYPAVDGRMSSGSMQALAESPMLSRPRMEWYLEQYLPEGHDREDPRFSPLLSERLEGQPRALILVAGHDPLWDDGQSHARALRAAGVEVELREYPGQVHGFLNLTKVQPEGRTAIADVAGWLRAVFADAPATRVEESA
ncbi:alpha/beta hydrolase [Pseudooceanicola nanhaiensis]|jgi:acetyl esterase|uniref:Alpha/beta hydrolase n=1 Tax=Pseudooceanicola nanhaiensis TaxID=375761 RepID=A0A917WEP4_9RHOB|nr:alpha/beta hydrolase [Pseudooceanicola nanhaiensis]GGL97722.1 alpha/beta hydrolase [Pseudooceanicola nanhaiensis]